MKNDASSNLDKIGGSNKVCYLIQNKLRKL